MKTKILSILALLLTVTQGAWAQNKPSGHFDSAVGHQGSISVSGWVWDQDQPNTSISVHVYVFKDKNGDLNPSPSNSNVLASQSIEANNYRSDIISITSDNGNHGFALTFEVNATPGTYYVCAWGIDGTDGNIVLGSGKDITILAPFTVSYNANGGSGAPSAQDKRYDITLTLSSTVPTRTGYTFTGWNTAADGTGTAYAAGATYSANADVTLYAQWTPTYTATFAAGNDNTGWTIDPASDVEGATVTVSYSGENKVKSVTVQAKPICALSAVTSAHVGKVIGADGNVYNTVAQANTATTACGVIAYVGSAGEVHSAYAAHKGIAVSLDETLLAYSTVNEDLDSPTSDFATVLTWKNGEFTTNAAVAKGTYPAFTWAAGHNTTPGRVSGASAWFLPSVGQWNLAVRGMTGSNTDLKEGSSNANSNMDRDKLNVVLNAAGASPLGVGNYMMATEYSTTEFWEYIYLGYFDHMGKSAAFAVRPIFTF